MSFKAVYHVWKSVFQFYDTGVWKVSFLMVPAFCDQVLAKLVVESCTGERNLKVSLDIVREKCTWRFYNVGSEGFQQMH